MAKLLLEAHATSHALGTNDSTLEALSSLNKHHITIPVKAERVSQLEYK